MKNYLKKEVTNPIPMESLESECKKAYTILKGFVTPVKYQPDKFIPPFVLQRARGLAVLSVIKGGFVFSGRVGAGVVIARTEDGSWSAPAAIGTAGVGWGFQAGAELADFVIVLNTKDAVKAFSHGNVTLGGNVSVAAGPIGRNAEAAAAVTITAVFSYSRTRGLFAGVSLEGSIIAERKDANKKFYGDHATTRAILSGAIARPNAAKDLYELLHKIDKNEIKEISHGSHGHGSGVHHNPHGSYSQGGGGFPGAPPPGAPPGGYYDQQGNYREAPPGSYDPNGQGYYNGPPPGGYYDEQGNYREAPPGGPGGYPPSGGFNPQQSGNYGPGGYQPHPSYNGPPGGPPGQMPPGSYRDAPSGNFGGPQGGPPLQQQGSFNNGPPGGPPGQMPPGSYRDAPSGNFGGPQGGPPLQHQGSFNNGPPEGPGNFQPQQSFNNGPQNNFGPPGGPGGYQPQQSFNNGPQNNFGPPGGPGGYQPQQSFNNGPQNNFNGPPGGYPPQQSFNGPPGAYGGQRDMGMGDQQFQPQPSQGGGSHIGAPGGGPIGKAKGVYNFDAADDTELSFKFDDIIVIWKQHGDWWEGELNGRRGLIPANYVELL